MPRDRSRPRRVCFVTGTRAEFGLMASALEAIVRTERLQPQIIATGMHLDPRHGDGLSEIRKSGLRVNRTIPWPRARDAVDTAAATGWALARLARVFDELSTDIVLIVGDRVEAFAAAAAAAISGRVVAHVHGGDRALGQVDDSLRHAITKVAHVHFPATPGSATRLARLGEAPWRIHRVGSPGLDAISQRATTCRELARAFSSLPPRKYALVVLHPTDLDATLESRRAKLLLRILLDAGIPRAMIIGPNNDPGATGIMSAWREAEADDDRVVFHPDVPRAHYLGLMRDAAFLIGNSSSGIIEAASFHTPVIDVGPRQQGRERGANVRSLPWDANAIRGAIAAVWRAGKAPRIACDNPYGGGRAGRGIARVLASVPLDARLRRKLISY
jgi:GDP/UDP-N,N'-diacetylbacillosamine 2-epimerase (hydrolysing)